MVRQKPERREDLTLNIPAKKKIDTSIRNYHVYSVNFDGKIKAERKGLMIYHLQFLN